MDSRRPFVVWIGVFVVACSSRTETPASPSEVVALPVVSPDDNPTSEAKVELGRLLFWDPILSGNRDLACASCHHPDLAYTDGRSLAIGTGNKQGTRNTLTILDTAWNGATSGAPDPTTAPMFWDNRTRSLEEQAKGPIENPDEMCGATYDAHSIFPEVIARLDDNPEYARRFADVFGAGSCTAENVTRAIAAFERTLVDHDSSYDRNVLTATQLRGKQTFEDSGCGGCHSGPMFSDFQLHDLQGGSFRTASLRNVARTAPYFHDGSLPTLDAVFELYRRIDRRASDPKLRNLKIPTGSARSDVIAFLGALSDGDYDKTIPTSVPSGLTVGGLHP